jgi:hypothetical protein
VNTGLEEQRSRARLRIYDLRYSGDRAFPQIRFTIFTHRLHSPVFIGSLLFPTTA